MIKLTSEQVTDLHEGNEVEGYEGWSIDFDLTTGDMGSSYLYDYQILLFDKTDWLVGTAIGGMYSDYEHTFNDDLEFVPSTPETELSKFNWFLIEMAHKAMDVASDLGQITAKLTEITEYVNKIKQ